MYNSLPSEATLGPTTLRRTLHLPLEVLLKLPLGAELPLSADEDPFETEPCLCVVLQCISLSVRSLFKGAIRACL